MLGYPLVGAHDLNDPSQAKPRLKAHFLSCIVTIFVLFSFYHAEQLP